MNIVTVDFETYYDKDYSLSKMTTEAYVRDPRFQVIGVGVKVNNQPVDTYCGSYPEKFLRSMDWSNVAVLCHNTAFDGAIMSWHFGIRPKLWLDTLSMARALHGTSVRGSLKYLAEHYKIGVKGTEVENALGKRREHFTEQQLAAYMEYCANDVDLTRTLFSKMVKSFPAAELFAIDQTLRMYTEPRIELDTALLQQHLSEVRQRKQDLLDSVNVSLEDLMSNNKFADVLRRLNVEPPTKVSLTTGKQAFAFAKSDKGMTDLLEHHDDRVQAVVSARLGVKSTIEETRTENLIEVAGRGALPVMLNYYGAHTGRFSGGDKLNLQNLPARGNNTIRRALRPPPGHRMIAADSSQIEARMVAWLAGQDDLLQAFREGRDVYSEFASEVYGRPITKADKVERFVGKTCVAEGTLVLSYDGWKPIEKVTTSDKLWDGEEWVCHQGLLYNGIKPTLNLCGTWLTPDHRVWSGTQWLEAQSVVADESTLYQVLDTGAENLPWSATSLARAVESVPSSFGVTATQRSTPLTTITSRISKALAALCAPRKRRLRNAIGCTAKQWQTMPIGLAYSIVSLQQSLDATTSLAKCSSTMVGGVSGYATSGKATARRSSGTFRPLKAGITLVSRWIESVLTAATNRGISASYRAAITSAIKGKSRISKPVYDILNSGSRNRFTILTEAGPVIVHNCILGLGYGMGAEKFRRTLEIGQAGISVKVDITEADRIVRLYRQKNFKITQLWNECGSALTAMVQGGTGRIRGILPYGGNKVELPSKLHLTYPLLRPTTNGFEYVADARTYNKAVTDPTAAIPYTKIYGGKMVENIVQALASIVIREQMTRIGERGYTPLFQVHDEIVIAAPESEADAVAAMLEVVMSTPPAWAANLPVACEVGTGDNYGDT